MKKLLGFLLLAGLLSAQGIVWAEEVKPAVPAAEETVAVKDETVLHTEGVIPGPAKSDIVDAKKKAADETASAIEDAKEEAEVKE